MGAIDGVRVLDVALGEATRCPRTALHGFDGPCLEALGLNACGVQHARDSPLARLARIGNGAIHTIKGMYFVIFGYIFNNK